MTSDDFVDIMEDDDVDYIDDTGIIFGFTVELDLLMYVGCAMCDYCTTRLFDGWECEKTVREDVELTIKDVITSAKCPHKHLFDQRKEKVIQDILIGFIVPDATI